MARSRVDLGDDRRGRDRRALRVPVHDGPVRRRERAEAEPVHETDLGGRRERGERLAQRAQVRAVEPVAVDALRRDDADDDPRRARATRLGRALALVRRDLLRVVQERERPHGVVAQALVVEEDAAATSGPARLPRPASSAPATKRTPSLRSNARSLWPLRRIGRSR